MAVAPNDGQGAVDDPDDLPDPPALFAPGDDAAAAGAGAAVVDFFAFAPNDGQGAVDDPDDFPDVPALLPALFAAGDDATTAGFAFAPPDECEVSSATRPSMNGDTRAAPYFFFNAPHTDAPRFAQIVGTLDTFPGSVAS